MPIKLVSSRSSLRLMGGFAAVLLVFCVTAWVSWRDIDRILSATRDIVAQQEGLELSLRMENEALRMSESMANLISGDANAIEFFRAAGRSLNQQRSLLHHRIGSEEERKMLGRAFTLQKEASDALELNLAPALAARDEAEVRRRRERIGGLLLEIQRTAGKLRGGFELRIDQANLRAAEIRRDALEYSGWMLFVALVVAVTAGMAASRSVVAPITALVEATQAVARGDLSRRLDENRRDEFGGLARSFNRMTTDLRESQRLLIQAEKMASLGRLAAGVAHEINNPIGVIIGYSRMLNGVAGLSEQARGDLRAIAEEAEHCRQVVQDLLNLSRAIPPAETVVDLGMIVREALDREESAAAAAGVTIARSFHLGPLPARAEASRLRQAMRNLVRNAIEAMPNGGMLRVTLQREDRGDDGAWAVAEFDDTGSGMPPAVMEHIFEPFYTTKANGTGMGLAIAYNVSRAYGGGIAARSEPGHGSVFTLRLPLAVKAPETAAESSGRT